MAHYETRVQSFILDDRRCRTGRDVERSREIRELWATPHMPRFREVKCEESGVTRGEAAEVNVTEQQDRLHGTERVPVLLGTAASSG